MSFRFRQQGMKGVPIIIILAVKASRYLDFGITKNSKNKQTNKQTKLIKKLNKNKTKKKQKRKLLNCKKLQSQLQRLNYSRSEDNVFHENCEVTNQLLNSKKKN